MYDIVYIVIHHVKPKIAPMREKKTEVLTVRLAPSVKKALESLAKKDDRSLSQVVGRLLSKATGGGKKG